MTKFVKKSLCNLMVLVLAFSLSACSSSSDSASTGGSGTLQLALTDATTDAYQAIYVTIAEVQVNKRSAGDGEEAGWQTLLTPGGTYNLLELVNGTLADLGIADLSAGEYAQMRLILDEDPDPNADLNIVGTTHPYGNYLILNDEDDTVKELKIPSGMRTGIKIVHGFTIVRSGATELILDFDAAKSVVQAGNSGLWHLKPTIKVLATVENSVSGTVVAASDDSPLPGTLVSAQLFDVAAADASDAVTVETATVTDDDGAYTMYLPADIYNVVAVRDGYLPACFEVDATVFDAHIADFALESTNMGSLSGTVSGLATADDSVTISIRQTLDCGGMDAPQVEVQALNVIEGSAYSFNLPVGSYMIVVSAVGKTTLEIDVVIADGLDTLQDATFL